MSILVVLDVNTLASAVVFPNRNQGRVVALGLTNQIRLVLSEDMIDTLRIVLERPYFIARTTPDRRSRYTSALRKAAILVATDESVVGICDDREDDIVLGTAVAAGADYVVTGDHGFRRIERYGSVQIVTAREFLSVIDS